MEVSQTGQCHTGFTMGHGFSGPIFPRLSEDWAWDQLLEALFLSSSASSNYSVLWKYKSVV